MRNVLLSLFPLLAVLSSCQWQSQSCIISVADLPLKDTNPPAFDWQNTPLRANAQYILYGANSSRERAARLGDYYFVDWYDAEPTKPAALVMRYTQSKTGPQELQRRIEYKEPRPRAASHGERFFFNGQERAERGDILTWRLELYVDGKLMDSKQSYLWQ